MKPVIINCERNRNFAVDQINQLEVNKELPWIVSFIKADQSRSNAQNSLMWMIYTDMENTEINEYSGTTKKEWHYFFKTEYLVTIFYEGNLKGTYVDLIDSFNNLCELGHCNENSVIEQFIIDNTSTKDCSVKQFTQYLQSIMSFCREKGIVHRHPEDLYYRAMGYAYSEE